MHQGNEKSKTKRRIPGKASRDKSEDAEMDSDELLTSDSPFHNKYVLATFDKPVDNAVRDKIIRIALDVRGKDRHRLMPCFDNQGRVLGGKKVYDINNAIRKERERRASNQQKSRARKITENDTGQQQGRKGLRRSKKTNNRSFSRQEEIALIRSPLTIQTDAEQPLNSATEKQIMQIAREVRPTERHLHMPCFGKSGYLHNSGPKFKGVIERMRMERERRLAKRKSLRSKKSSTVKSLEHEVYQPRGTGSVNGHAEAAVKVQNELQSRVGSIETSSHQQSISVIDSSVGSESASDAGLFQQKPCQLPTARRNGTGKTATDWGHWRGNPKDAREQQRKNRTTDEPQLSKSSRKSTTNRRSSSISTLETAVCDLTASPSSSRKVDLHNEDPDSEIEPSQINAYQRDRRVGTISGRRKIREDIFQTDDTCDICHRGDSCSCDPKQKEQPPPEEIRCDSEGCSKTSFNNSYLGRFIGIQLEDANTARRDNGFWFCPECSHRKTVQHSQISSAFVLHPVLPQFGSDTLDDDDVRQSLNRFSGLILQYLGVIHDKILPPNMRSTQPLPYIACIWQETLDSKYELQNPFVFTLRRVLGNPGTLLKDMLSKDRLQNLDLAVWVRAVLVFMFHEFLFNSGEPFEDGIWRKSLLHSGRPDTLVEMEIQDNRIQTMREQTEAYCSRRKDQHEKNVKRLNETMMPLVGGNEELNRLHIKISHLAGDLNAKFSAYTGKFEGIMPSVGDKFDPKIHALENVEDSKDISGRSVLMTTMVGVKFAIPGKPWRICSTAKVRLSLPADKTPPSQTSPTSQAESSSQWTGLKKRAFQDLTS